MGGVNAAMFANAFNVFQGATSPASGTYQSSPAQQQAHNTTQPQSQQNQPKPGDEHKGDPYSLKPTGSRPAGNGGMYYTYQVVDPTGTAVRDVWVQEHVKVLVAENVNLNANKNKPAVYYQTGEVTDHIGPKAPPRTDIHSYFKTEQTFTATKGGNRYDLSTKTNQYINNIHGTVTVRVVVVVP